MGKLPCFSAALAAIKLRNNFTCGRTNVSETCHASRPFPAPLICVRNQIARFEHKVLATTSGKKNKRSGKKREREDNSLFKDEQLESLLLLLLRCITKLKLEIIKYMKTKTKQSFVRQQKQRGIYWKVSIDVVPRCVCKYFAASAATWQHQRPLWPSPALARSCFYFFFFFYCCCCRRSTCECKWR